MGAPQAWGLGKVLGYGGNNLEVRDPFLVFADKWLCDHKQSTEGLCRAGSLCV